MTLSVNLFLTSSSSEPLPEPSVGPLDTSNWKLKKMKLHGKNKSLWKIYIIYSIYGTSFHHLKIQALINLSVNKINEKNDITAILDNWKARRDKIID